MKVTQARTTVHPLIVNRADPWVFKHSDGTYYFTATEPGYAYIELRRASTIEGLADASPAIVWRKHPVGRMSANIWAPEIHYIENKWYIYFAAAETSETLNGLFDHRMYVLENDSPNPMEGTWVEKGQIITNWESFALDATTFEHKGSRYLVWAQKDPQIKGNSNLYLARMSSPWSIQGKQICIATPEYDWETIGFLVNEGPAVLKRTGRIFISYSASCT
ncbi:MAG TPA: family 43 glycosylhydrolase, partial [Bacilli bacterium]